MGAHVADESIARLFERKPQGLVAALEQSMRQLPPEGLAEFAQSIETSHYFAPGMYARKVFRKAGVVIVGKVHLAEHLYIVTKGRVAVTDEADQAHLYEAGDVIVSKPGTKRAVVALEDSICMTVHRTEKTDLDEIEAELIAPDPLALFDSDNKLKFDALDFREVTQRVIAAEKPGFWSDWTEKERELYKGGQWRAFSASRGYSEPEIADYAAWLTMIQKAQGCGINPYACIADLATQAASANIARDTKGEILKSSHLPFSRGETV